MPPRAAPQPPLPPPAAAEPDAAAERAALGRVAHALLSYPAAAEAEICRWERAWARLPARHRALLSRLPAKAAAARAAARQNAAFLAAAVDAGAALGAPSPLDSARAAAAEWAAAHGGFVSPEDEAKVGYVLRCAARDWATEAAPERAASYGRVLAELRLRLELPELGGDGASPDDSAGEPPARPRRLPRVLVPGCGLARLPAEVAALGCEAVGNEFSYYMLLASAFLLNCSSEVGEFEVRPWALATCNQAADAARLRAAYLPDALPGDLAARGALAMVAGDFVEARLCLFAWFAFLLLWLFLLSAAFVACSSTIILIAYTAIATTQVFSAPEHAGAFDAVATAFFLDTAQNALEYMETILHALKPGGWWINFGPLLWHWADAGAYLGGGAEGAEPLSLELPLDELAAAAEALGFEFARREVVGGVPYMADARALARREFSCAFWAARKPSAQGGEGGAGGGVGGGAA
jgi:carnosine N-methyltransferase